MSQTTFDPDFYDPTPIKSDTGKATTIVHTYRIGRGLMRHWIYDLSMRLVMSFLEPWCSQN